jgi:hypothetical protein
MKALLRAAWQLTTVRFMLGQIVLAVVGFVLFAAWLRLPDSTVPAILSSVLLALVIVFVVFAGEAWLLLRLRGLPATARALARGALALLIAVALLFPLSMLLTHLSADDALRAGYFNSRFPANLRNVFSYPHLLTLLHETWDSLFWALLIVFAMAAVAITAAHKPLAAFVRMFRSLTAWVVLSLATIMGSWATVRLLHWTPGHGLAIEAGSVVLRLIVVVLLDAFLLCFSLALLVVLAKESDARYLPAATDAGTPDLSQPRTVERP